MEQYMTLKEFREYMRYSRSLVDKLIREDGGSDGLSPRRPLA